MRTFIIVFVFLLTWGLEAIIVVAGTVLAYEGKHMAMPVGLAGLIGAMACGLATLFAWESSTPAPCACKEDDDDDDWLHDEAEV